MASKRKVRRNACEGKRAYDTKAEAETGRAGLLYFKQIQGGRRLDVYKCPFGNHWHVGHRPGWVPRNKRQST